MAEHTIFFDDADSEASRIAIGGEEGRHAVRVKRVRAGERVTILNGAGLALVGRVVEAKRALIVDIDDVRRVERLRPELEVWCPAPKGTRAADLVDGLSQVGAAVWRPLVTERAGKGVTERKEARLERVAVEAAKQCGRAWLLKIGEEGTLEEALAVEEGEAVIVADRRGGAFAGAPAEAGRVRLLIGPEGGWSDREMERISGGGASVARFGAHVMRVETAAVVASGIVLSSLGACAPDEPESGSI